MPNTPEMQPIICAGLRRVSLPGQVENYSLDAQDHEFDELEKKFNCRIPPEYRVSDEGFSGADPNRPSIKLVMKWLLEGTIQGVAFAHLDRSSRDMEDGLSRIRMYREAGGQVLFGNLGWVTDERELKTQIQLGLMFSEMQRDDIRAKTMAGTMQKIRAGVAHGMSPWGWRTITAAELAYEAMQKGKPAPRKPQNYRVVVREEQEAYRLMEDLALAGHGLRGICRELRLREIKTRRGNDFNATTLGEILRDDCYWTAQWFYNKRNTVKPKKLRKLHIERHRMKSTHKWRPRSEWVGPQELPGGPITTKERHEAVLEALKRNGKVSEGRPVTEGGYEAILKNLLKCRLCGYAMVPIHKNTPTGCKCWYVCSNRDRVTGKHLCPARAVKAAVLEEAVWDAMCEAYTTDLDRHIREYRDQLIAKTDAAELEQMRAAETRLLAKMTEAIDRELDADEPEEKRHYAQRIAEFKGQLKLLRWRIASFTSVAHPIEVDAASIRQIIQAGMRSQDRAKRRAVLLAFVHEVRYAEGLAELVLKIPTLPGVNCQHTHLLLARATNRKREIAIRIAVGAGRGGIARQLLTENILLAIAGGTCGLLLAFWGTRFLEKLVPSGIAALTALRVDGRVLGFTLAISIATALIFGLAPAIQSLQVDLHQTLKQGGDRSATRGKRGMERTLVIVEVALAFVLAIGAALMIQTFAHLRGMDPGFRTKDILSVRMASRSRFRAPERRAAFYENVLRRVTALPGVISAGFSNGVPVAFKGWVNGFTIEGQPALGGDRITNANYRVVTPDYLRTLAIPVREGRALDAHDTADAPHVAVINESMRRKFWMNEDPLGKRRGLAPQNPGSPSWVSSATFDRRDSIRRLRRRYTFPLFSSLHSRAGWLFAQRATLKALPRRCARQSAPSMLIPQSSV